jgi:prolyl-tRNA editing enzyme YbaK/EbsC (Cys-tRNA(Pro) deacylase)
MQEEFALISQIADEYSLLFEHYQSAYQFDVVTCVEAAKARKVPLSRELKHLIIDASGTLCLVHIPGDREVQLEKVASSLSLKFSKVNLANIVQINDDRIKRGIICPFKQPFWSWKHLIHKDLLDNDWMTTNDGTKKGYIRFDPKLLCHAKKHVINIYY